MNFTLCVSQLILVTPFTLKSKGSRAYSPASPFAKPAFSKKGTMKLPRQQSTCMPMLYCEASAPSPVMSS